MAAKHKTLMILLLSILTLSTAGCSSSTANGNSDTSSAANRTEDNSHRRYV